MIVINEETTIVKKQILQEPQVHITGNSSNNSRTMTVSILVLDESGNEIDKIVKQYTGQDFNDAYAIYATDKALIDYVLAESEYSGSNTDTIPENLENNIPISEP